METFTPEKDIIEDKDYLKRRSESLSSLDLEKIDMPIRPLIESINSLDHCFTLQSCWGHFIYKKGQADDNLDYLEEGHDPNSRVLYRIAYIALCLKDCSKGRDFLEKMKVIGDINMDFIQFGCADWFWKRYPNSFVLQVEPYRYRYKDSIELSYSEALDVQKVRKEFFFRLRAVMAESLMS